MLDQGHIIAWLAFDLSAMEKLLAISKPCHVICFCKFAENISNPIMWSRGKTCIKYIRLLLGKRGSVGGLLNAGSFGNMGMETPQPKGSNLSTWSFTFEECLSPTL